MNECQWEKSHLFLRLSVSEIDIWKNGKFTEYMGEANHSIFLSAQTCSIMEASTIEQMNMSNNKTSLKVNIDEQ